MHDHPVHRGDRGFRAAQRDTPARFLDAVENPERYEGVEFVEALEGEDGDVHVRMVADRWRATGTKVISEPDLSTDEQGWRATNSPRYSGRRIKCDGCSMLSAARLARGLFIHSRIPQGIRLAPPLPILIFSPRNRAPLTS